MNDIYYSNEVDSNETLPLLNGVSITPSSESEVDIFWSSYLSHSIIRGVII